MYLTAQNTSNSAKMREAQGLWLSIGLNAHFCHERRNQDFMALNSLGILLSSGTNLWKQILVPKSSSPACLH